MPLQVLDSAADGVVNQIKPDSAADGVVDKIKPDPKDAKGYPAIKKGEGDIPANCWRIHGRDYDLTDFVDEHPGGRVSILLGKGVDCTNLFESYHIFNEPRKRLQKYAVGDKDEPVPEDPSEFHREFRQLLKDHFKGQGKWAHKAKWSHAALIGVALGVEFVSWYGWYTGQTWALLTLPLAAWIIMTNVAHDGSHFATSKHPIVNEWGLAMAAPFFYTNTSWYIQHVVSHHQETNQPGNDADLHHMPFSRWHRGVAHEGNFSGVGNLLWQVLAFTLSSVMLSVVHPFKFAIWPMGEYLIYGGEGMSSVYFGNHKETPVPLHDGSGPTELAVMRIGGALTRAGYMISRISLDVTLWLWSLSVLVLPWYLHGVNGKALAFAIIPFVIASLFFMVVTQVSHVQEETQTNEIVNEPDFFKRQAMTSMDYSAPSNFARFWTGGLNMQSIHHVCPGLNSSHYTDIYPAFHALCVKHGCAPAKADNIVHALYKHLKYVYRLGANYKFPEFE
eukprot:CAMPEP_0118862098 /NCGR_PEP_ID=MMETSP1163-20130328/7412_1 /TAXON_ID=124430 /ORGANISM="Phaeomonas parva, Strain CCMP2877" /LENGTH=503 /DNA_ID=CAMNT_0006795965 /DNA_START=145 /DNA_END=1653 /DNA_ORIENTATION=-